METDPFAALGAVLGSMALGMLKKHTHTLDGRIGGAIKPFQPLLVAAAGIGLPYLTQAIGIASVDPATFVTAPLTTLALVSARESYERLSGRKQRQQ